MYIIMNFLGGVMSNILQKVTYLFYRKTNSRIFIFINLYYNILNVYIK